MRDKKVAKRDVEPDLLYNNKLITKLINRIMKDGKKSTAQKSIYQALDVLKNKGMDPLVTFEKAVQNISPKVEVKARRVGGASYQVPIEVRGDRRLSLSIRWIVQAAHARSNKEYHTFSDKLAAEIIDASNNLGAAIKKRDTMHRMAEANRAFAHFRW